MKTFLEFNIFGIKFAESLLELQKDIFELILQTMKS